MTLTNDQRRAAYAWLKWCEDQGQPFVVPPLGDDKYYGTIVRNGSGDEVFRFSGRGVPSAREMASPGTTPDWQPCDGHYETAEAFAAAEAFVELPNILRTIVDDE